jgi:hypothetical protein
VNRSLKKGFYTLVVCWLCGTSFATLSPNPQARAEASHVVEATKNSRPVGTLPASSRLNLAIGLPLRNRGTLSEFLARLYDPSKPQYHHYLSPAQFTAEFGPSEKDYEAVIAYAQANGFTVTATHANRMLVDVQANVSQIERAFHTALRVYPHPTENRTFFAPDSEPLFDTTVPILYVSGLNDYMRPRANLIKHSLNELSKAHPQVGTGPNGTFWGNDFRKAYASGVSLNGAGQMLGLLEFDGYYVYDINLYRSGTHGVNVPLINVLLDGFDGTPGQDNVEVALDIEVAGAMAPGLSAIIVYEGGDGNDILNRMATDNLAKQLSSSWSFPGDSTTEQILQEMAAQGQSYFSASGDLGAYTSGAPSPFDYPYVTSVGGTTLHTTSTGAWQSEASWNQADGTTGGGISTSFAIPSWQQGINMTTNLGSTAMRNLPDVSMIADLTWCYYDNGSSSFVSGTSIGAPLWAGFVAMVNQQSASLNQPSAGFINPAVYAISQGPGYSTNFHDIIAGNNTNSASPTQFFAVPGFDLCTGVGSPIGLNLINTLAPRPTTVLVTNVAATLVSEGCSPANGVIDPGETVTINLSLKNLGAVSTSNLVATLQADSGIISPSAPQSYGVLAGGGAAVSRPFTFTANGVCGSNLTATVLLSDGSNSVGNLALNFPVGAAVTVFSENFDTVSPPALPTDWSSSKSGAVSNWVTATTLHDSAPNAAFIFEPTNPGVADLVSAPFEITTPSATLTFRQNYNMETYPDNPANAYDGGLLQIQIGGGNFTDILAAGGSFVSGGYNKVIKSDPPGDNPFDGKQVWSGLSGGFTTTVVALPPSAAGQSVRVKWRFGTDNGNDFGGTGWYIDGVTVQDGYNCCSSSSTGPVISIIGFGANPTNVSISFSSLLGLTYSLEYKNSLGDMTWSPIAPALPGTGAGMILQDTNPPVYPSRFYRVRAY